MQVLQTLTLAEVKAKAREFYDNKKLTAQHPLRERRDCINDGGDGFRCAVAAAFNDATMAAFPTGTIGILTNSGRVIVDNFEAINAIQVAYDYWAIDSQHEGEDSASAKKSKAKFLSLIAA